MSDHQRHLHIGSGPALTRRGFLISTFAAGTSFGFPRMPLAAIDPATSDLSPVEAVGQVFEPTVWYWMDAEGQVNVNINRAEMGQHIGTAIARILADELSVEWKNIHITYVDNKKQWAGGPTAGSTSISQSWPVYRQAGAAGRIALVEAAAQRWGLDPSDCQALNGQITGGGHTISYGELVAAGLSRQFSDDELKSLPLKPHAQLKLFGQDVSALDITNKTNGRAIYGIETKVDGMVYGVPLIPPTRMGSSVIAIDDSDAKHQAGYLRTVNLDDPSGIVPGMVVVVGKTLMAAKWASERVKVDWTPGDTADVSEADIQGLSRKLIDDESAGGNLDTGNCDTGPVFKAAADTLEAEYTTQTVLYFTLEPMNATAFQNNEGQWEIHAGSLWLGLMDAWVQKALCVEADKVIMRTQLLGGGFGRRVFGDYVVAAALASKSMGGTPVKLVFFREDDILIDCPRSPSVQKMRMAFDADQNLMGMEHCAAAGWPGRTVRPESSLNEGVNGHRYDPTAIFGADHWYNVGEQKLRAISNDLASQTVRTGFLRSTGPGWTSSEAPVGLGEPGATGVAQAIANAIFNAVGVRMRHLPILPDAVLQALQSS